MLIRYLGVLLSMDQLGPLLGLNWFNSLLPLPAAPLRRHTLTVTRTGRQFPRLSRYLGAPSSPPLAAAFAVAGLRSPSAPHVHAASHPRGCPRGALVSAAVPRPGDAERRLCIVVTTVVRRRRRGRGGRSGLYIVLCCASVLICNTQHDTQKKYFVGPEFLTQY